MILKVELTPEEVADAVRYWIKTWHGVSVPTDGNVTQTFFGRQIEPGATYEVEIE